MQAQVWGAQSDVSFWRPTQTPCGLSEDGIGLCYLSSYPRNGMKLQDVEIQRLVFNTEFAEEKGFCQAKKKPGADSRETSGQA